MAINIEQEVEPMLPKLSQAGGPHLAAHDATFVQQTQALWWRCSCTRRSWVWPEPDTAPYISTATLSTYTDMLIGDTSVNAALRLPWHFQKGVDGLSLWIGVALRSAYERASIRGTLTGLDAAITDKNSPAVIIPPTPLLAPGLWSMRTNTWRLSFSRVVFTGITASNMTADRRGSIKLAISFDPVTAPDAFSVLHEAKIYSVQAVDTFTPPTPEDEA